MIIFIKKIDTPCLAKLFLAYMKSILVLKKIFSAYIHYVGQFYENVGTEITKSQSLRIANVYSDAIEHSTQLLGYHGILLLDARRTKHL